MPKRTSPGRICRVLRRAGRARAQSSVAVSGADLQAQSGPSSKDNMRAQLKNVGLRATGQRLKVLEVFQSDERRHLTAEEVHRYLRQGKEHVSLATVYRVMNELTAVGILCRQMLEHGKARYELDRGEQHDHLVCIECGRVDEFVDALIEQRKKLVAQSSRYAIVRHEHTLFGYCAVCRGARKNGRAGPIASRGGSNGAAS